MNALSRWVQAHGGWTKAPLQQHHRYRVPDYTTIHFRLSHRWALMRYVSARQAYEALRARRERA